ncbi:hypothetical protein CAEBREN_08170 [Caenorhabditis brenneri]|uniref:Protein sleepless n=1 Tax=Caenorhabditis brenneri TaxID=135651 RepID=G0MPU3_CAEBE|nr:hypothetical protein CAEBREN_08170 [Caenorhabditis brenneri]
MRLLLLFILLPFLCSSQKLLCYHCISQLASSDITVAERNALKMALFARFNIPPSSEYCAYTEGGNDILFKSVAQEECPVINDSCVRIISEGDENRKLVLRGCQSTLMKPGFDLITNYSCHRSNSDTTSSECVTTCQEQLCNNSHGFNLILVILGYLIL